MIQTLLVLAQLDVTKKLDSAQPALNADASPVMTWIIAALLLVGVLAVTFKTTKRNFLEKD